VLDEVAVVAADGAQGSVVVAGVPAAGAQVTWREQFCLELRGEVEVALECVALGFVQVVEAVANERICEQAVFLDGVVALLAEAIGSASHPVEGRVDFAKEGLEVLVMWGVRERGFQAEFAVGYFGLQELHLLHCDGHDSSEMLGLFDE
jgi:hypothetical protein